jgi:hypothetical protein
VVEATDLIGFEMAPGDVAQLAGIDQRGHGVAQGRKHGLEPGVKQQRLRVAHQEVVELQIEVRHMDREPEQVGGDLRDDNHGSGVNGREAKGQRCHSLTSEHTDALRTESRSLQKNPTIRASMTHQH